MAFPTRGNEILNQHTCLARAVRRDYVGWPAREGPLIPLVGQRPWAWIEQSQRKWGPVSHIIMPKASHRPAVRTVGLGVLLLALVYLVSGLNIFGSSAKKFASRENGMFWNKNFFYSQNVAWESA